MKILLLTQVLPYPPDSGPKVKTWNVLKYLALHHEVTLISFVRGDQTKEVEHIKSYCKNVFTVPMRRGIRYELIALWKSLLSKIPWIIARDARQEMFTLVERVAAQDDFDYVHADQLNMAQYAESIAGVKRVFDAHNALWMLYKRLSEQLKFGPIKWLYQRDWRLLQAYEGRICREFDHVLAVSEEDRNALMEVAKKTNLSMIVAPIAIDTDEVKPIERNLDSKRLVSIGTMFWLPNVDGILWFAREVYPLIQAKMSEVTFDVIGARPPAEIQALASDNPGIRVHGYVENPLEYVENAAVMVVPLRAGGGMRVKILNALAQAMPIVTTTIGCEGIGVKNGEQLLIGDRSEEFADAILTILQHPDMGVRLGQSGRQLMEDHYDYRMACRPLDQIYCTTMKRGVPDEE